MTRFRNLLIILVAFLSYTSCQRQDDSCFGEGNAVAPTLNNRRDVAKGAEIFTMKFFSFLAQKHPSRNVVVSPYSLWGVLKTAFYGAAGRTRAQLQNALGFKSVSDGFYNAAFLQASLAAKGRGNDKGIQFYELNEAYFADYINIRRCVFSKVVTLKKVDFKDAVTTSEIINTSVRKATRGHIPTFLKPVDLRGAEFILINAVYFKGSWLHPFAPTATASRDFYGIDGVTKQGKADMMSIPGAKKLKYFRDTNEKFQLVQLPYDDGTGQESDVAMWIILPDIGVNASTILAGLTSAKLDQLDTDSKVKSVEVSLPKFNMTLRLSEEAKQGMQQQGIVDMFDASKANMTNFGPQRGLHIQTALHHVTIVVNEEGTVAVAVSGLIGTRSGASDFEIMNVNRPFIFLIRDSDLKVTLFTGVMRDIRQLKA